MVGENRCMMLVNPSSSKVLNTFKRLVYTFGSIRYQVEVESIAFNQGGIAGNSRPCFWGREFFVFFAWLKVKKIRRFKLCWILNC